MPSTPVPYTIALVNAVGLDAAERSAAELRFRMALEAGVGGREWVIPALQACMLARSLISHQPTEALDGADAEREVIALWENAENQAIMTALKPLDRDMGNARFEISV